MLPMVASGLSEPIVEETTARGANPIEKPVKHLAPVFVLVEAKLEKVVHESTGLRVAE